jgi:hypothetical protein
MHRAIKSDNWEIIDNLPIDDPSLLPEPDYFKQDSISKNFTFTTLAKIFQFQEKRALVLNAWQRGKIGISSSAPSPVIPALSPL